MFVQSKHSYITFSLPKIKFLLRKKIENKKQNKKKNSNETHNKQIHFTMQRHIQIMRDVQMLIHRINLCFFFLLFYEIIKFVHCQIREISFLSSNFCFLMEFQQWQ